MAVQAARLAGTGDDGEQQRRGLPSVLFFMPPAVVNVT